MGLRWQAVELIDFIKPYLPEKPACYMIGTQDCGFSYKTLLKRYSNAVKCIKNNEVDLKKDCDLKFLFKVLGFDSAITVDMNKRADLYLDLTKDIPRDHIGKADLVLDFGTLEHIFDVKKAVCNMNLFLKPGGVIFHMSPVSFFRHGFYNFNPNFFDALYNSSSYKQVFKTMHISIYNPFYVINLDDLPEPLKKLFGLTNRLFRSAALFRFNLPLSLVSENRVLKIFNFLTTHFSIPKNLMYCCAYKKISNSISIPYDIWE